MVKALIDMRCGRTLVKGVPGPLTKEVLRMRCIHGDVKSYGTKCVELQIGKKLYQCKVGVVPQARETQRGLLQPMPLLTTLFEQVGIDLVVPLVPSTSKHHFIWVLIDYATRYPVLFPSETSRLKQWSGNWPKY